MIYICFGVFLTISQHLIKKDLVLFAAYWPSVADPEFAKGGGHGERAEREPKRGSGGGAPSGVQGQSPWWRVRGRSSPEAESFLYIFIQKVAKS